MDRQNIDKIAQTPEDRHLLAKLWDKIHKGMQKNIPANTNFLSPREQDLARYLFGDMAGLSVFGGYPDAERMMYVYVPEYFADSYLTGDEAPLVCLRATFYKGDTLTHRDFLGALMGSGIARETVGDILVSEGSCDFFVSAEVAPYILQNFESAGRTKLKLCQIPISDVSVPQPETIEIRDTLASLRLDSLIASGFRISRNVATGHIVAGRVAINGLLCDKPDKAVEMGVTISVRTMGKIKLRAVNGQTKKGRISVVIDRYV